MKRQGKLRRALGLAGLTLGWWSAALTLAMAGIGNPSGARVEALSAGIDSSVPFEMNAALAGASLAASDFGAEDLLNRSGAGGFLGLFDPLPALTAPRSAARDWALYR